MNLLRSVLRALGLSEAAPAHADAVPNGAAANTRFPLLVTARLREYCEPVDRGERYEDPLAAFLTRSGIGTFDGAGSNLTTQPGEMPTIESIELTFALRDSHEAVDLAVEELERLGAPRGSELHVTRAGAPIRRAFGKTECLAVFLDGTTLPDEVYANNDVNETLANLTHALVGPGIGAFRSHWQGNRETALFFFGANADDMKAAMMPVLLADPSCQNARVITKYGRGADGSAEERVPRRS